MLRVFAQCRLCGKQLGRKSFTRSLFNENGQWDAAFTSETRSKLEEHWKLKLRQLDKSSFEHEQKASQEKYYVLSMFPYPSGKLHMGHVRVYTISDVMARYHRLTGKYVIHPMGWDAFGLPAENAAIERGERPADWTHSNILAMKKQIEDLCCSFNWKTELATCDPDYYKWTQHIFLLMYRAGLVYQKEGAVNWDPVDQTVLADEQIDENGCSWRSGAKAEKRFIRQWYLKTTAYTKSLIDGLSEVKSDLWKDVIDLQRHWIGPCDGMRLEFKLKFEDSWMTDSLSVFTRHPHCIYGASHILISLQHYLNNGEFTKAKTVEGYTELKTLAENPLTGELLPMYVADDWSLPEALDSYLGVPDACDADKDLAAKMSLSYANVLDTNKENVINSGQLSGLSVSEAFQKLSVLAKEKGCGGHVTSDQARDWLISRQRYWGTPIPIVHCTKCGPVPVAFQDLPVKLPDVERFTGKGQSPLSSVTDWLHTKCPQCGGDAMRETDTMDTFVDSTWYFLRYLDHDNEEQPVNRELAARYLPVDLYIGGKEHARMHLYYARFVHHFLFDEGFVPQREPFVNLLTQGMVMGQSYQVTETGRYIPREQVDFSGSVPVEKDTEAALTLAWEKMSKSKHNGVDPQDVLDEFGCDATRLCILSNVAPKSDRNWSNDVFLGVRRWQSRIWSLVSSLRDNRERQTPALDPTELEKFDVEIQENRNYFVNQVNHHMDKTFLLSVSISRLQGLTNALKKVPGPVMSSSSSFEAALSDLVIMLAPFAPMFASELWEGLRHAAPHSTSQYDWSNNIWQQTWPRVDEDYKLPMKVLVDGKERYRVKLPMALSEMEGLTKREALALVQQSPHYEEYLKGKPLLNSILSYEPGVWAELDLHTKKPKKSAKKNIARETL